MSVYYNDNDKKVCKWLEELIRRGLIPKGDVDDRSITEIKPDDVRGYEQCHFFAGIGGWAYALQLAGWDGPVWTGSCPCQPFSQAGKRKGVEDERHLWPMFRDLIAKCQPPVVFGEQVASKDGRLWLAGVRTEVEALGYALGAADLCAAGFGAPHIRQRLYWVADSGCGGVRGERLKVDGAQGTDQGREEERQRVRADAGDGGTTGGVADTSRATRDGTELWEDPWSHHRVIVCRDEKTRRVSAQPGDEPLAHGLSEILGRLRAVESAALKEISDGHSSQEDADEAMRVVRQELLQKARREEQPTGVCVELHAETVLLGFLLCLQAARDATSHRSGFEKAGDEARRALLRGVWNGRRSDDSPHRRGRYEQRQGQSANPVQAVPLILARHAPSYRQEAILAHAASSRVVRLRGYGNAIVPQVAAEFVTAYMGVR